MIALLGDAEFDEGNVFEALLEGWKHDVRNVWWIIDYNRQSLDAIVTDRLVPADGHDLPRHGVERRHAEVRPAAASRRSTRRGGDALRDWIDACPNTPLLGRWRMPAARRGGRSCVAISATRRASASCSTSTTMTALHALMTNLGGHDLETVLDAFHGAAGRRADLLHRLHDQGLSACRSRGTRTTTPG